MKLPKFITAILKCEFHRRCRLYNPDSYTCNNKGGSICGEYRYQKEEKEKRVKREAAVAAVPMPA